MICATISKNTWDCDEEQSSNNEFNLKMIYSAEDYDKFMESLDFEYDNGYGLQELYGTVWFSDGTWLERWEYDGSEGWCHQSLPAIPDKLSYTL
jgi:hypothetical protein